MRVPTKNVFLTVDGVATRLAIRELKRAKIDSQPQLFSHEVHAGFKSLRTSAAFTAGCKMLICPAVFIRPVMAPHTRAAPNESQQSGPLQHLEKVLCALPGGEWGERR